MTENNDNHLKLFACCFPVKGASRSLICDVQRYKTYFIPNSLYDMLLCLNERSINSIYALYGANNEETITEYIQFLIENDLAFICPKKDLQNFPSINVDDFDLPYDISNAILELDDVDPVFLQTVVSQLIEVRCTAVEIRFLTQIELPQLDYVLSLFSDSIIKIINVILIDNGYNLEEVKNLFFIHLRVTKIFIGSSINEAYYSNFTPGSSEIIFTNRKIHLPSCCGNFSKNDLNYNISFFAEAQKFNTCLNRKVAIDKTGNIKNCPSMSVSFGNIFDTKISTVIQKSDFVEKWLINKDQIEICRDCEFRYNCMDCRAYLEDPSNNYSKPLKCGYSPYTNVWEEWSVNPLKNVAKTHYNLENI